MVTKEKIAWNSEADNALLSALGNDLCQIKKEVAEGSCELWRYDDGGYCVTRLEVTQSGKELVIVGSGVKNGAQKLREWVKLANSNGWTVRIHSKRLGMAKFLERQGFGKLETVYRWAKNGR